jgi:hypothetical protein
MSNIANVVTVPCLSGPAKTPVDVTDAAILARGMVAQPLQGSAIPTGRQLWPLSAS